MAFAPAAAAVSSAVSAAFLHAVDPSVAQPAVLLAYLGAIGGFIASVATLVGVLRGSRDAPQIFIVHDESEAQRVLEQQPKRRRRRTRVLVRPKADTDEEQG